MAFLRGTFLWKIRNHKFTISYKWGGTRIIGINFERRKFTYRKNNNNAREYSCVPFEKGEQCTGLTERVRFL